MVPEGWEWDPSLYAGSARYYSRGRLPYPPVVGAALRSELALDGTGRLLDVGCRPGSLTLVLAELFDEVVGVDADAGMMRRPVTRLVVSGAATCGGYAPEPSRCVRIWGTFTVTTAG